MGKIVHIVLWKLKAAAGEEAKAAINALKNVPGPESIHLGAPAIADRTKGFNWGLYSVFSSREALDKYAVSEAHMDVVINNVRPNTEGKVNRRFGLTPDVLAYDFELEN